MIVFAIICFAVLMMILISVTLNLKRIYELKKYIMAKQTELATALAGVTAQVEKIGTETAALKSEIVTLNQTVTDLETQINDLDNVSPELQTAFDALKAQVQVVDDLVPDAVPVPTPES